MPDFAGPLIALRAAAHEYALAMESRDYRHAETCATAMHYRSFELLRYVQQLRPAAGEIEYQSWFA